MLAEAFDSFLLSDALCFLFPKHGRPMIAVFYNKQAGTIQKHVCAQFFK